jgi:hypothetical protein
MFCTDCELADRPTFRYETIPYSYCIVKKKLFNKNGKFFGKYCKGSFLEVSWNLRCIAAILMVDTLAIK